MQQKNSFAKESKNLARYRSGNIFVTDQMSSPNTIKINM